MIGCMIDPNPMERLGWAERRLWALGELLQASKGHFDLHEKTVESHMEGIYEVAGVLEGVIKDLKGKGKGG